MKKLLGILVTIMILTAASAAFSEGMPAGFSVGVNWIDDDGFLYTEYASPVTYSGYENAYWLLVPYQAQGRLLTLFIEDPTGQYAAYMPGNGTELYNYIDAGADIRYASYTEIYCFDQNMNQSNLIRLYLSTSTEYPSQPDAVGATVTVRYIDSTSGSEIRSDLIECPGDQTTPVSAPDIYGYVLQSDDTQYVQVDSNGNPDRYSIEFYYSPVADAPVVTVRYIDMNTGYDIRQADQYTCELNTTTTVNAQSIDGYILSGDSQVYVTVDAYGNASTGEVVFYYTAVQAPVVTVRYIDMNTGSEIRQADQYTCELNTTTTINAQSIDGYILSGDSQVYVTVDAYGNTSTGEIVFYYTAVQAPVVTVRYIDMNTGSEIRQADKYT